MNINTSKNNAIADPVCGMTVIPDGTEFIATIDGKTFYFCTASCRQSFEKNPNKFLNPRSKKKKGIWGRYLERLEKASGGRAMKCH